jgi:hypothetical protein
MEITSVSSAAGNSPLVFAAQNFTPVSGRQLFKK